MNRLRVYILSLSMLVVLMVGLASQIYSFASVCSNATHMGVVEQHHCGHCCESHFPDCVNHTAAISHKCDDVKLSLSEYLPSTASKVNNLFVTFVFRVIEQTGLSLAVVDEQLSWRYALFDDTLFRGYDPSTGALRAPPVLG